MLFTGFAAKKKEAFRSLLEEQKDVPLDAAFKDIKKNIREDPRYSKFSSSDKKCEKEFGCWVSLGMSLSLMMIIIMFVFSYVTGFIRPGLSIDSC